MKLIAVVVLIFIAGYFLLNNHSKPQNPTPSQSVPIDTKSELTGTAKGVIGISNPKPGQKITSPLTVTGIVYVKKGEITITLKQKESGSVVNKPKTVQINGSSDNIQFAEAIQFGLPTKPQPGILEVSFKDETGKNADDKVEIEVEFPSDLGKGT